MGLLDSAEYIEQAYFFERAEERLKKGDPMQEILVGIRDEVLATTRLPLALDYMRSELNHVGQMASAMRTVAHYFTPFQAYIVGAAEDDLGRFDIRTAFRILHLEAKYRAKFPDPLDDSYRAGLFFYQFESLCRNRLRYDHGLAAIAQDPAYPKPWGKWIMEVRRNIESIGIADLVYVTSAHYVERESRKGVEGISMPADILFGEKEGKIALANRKKEPVRLFEALQRQLDYPPAPRNVPQHDPLEQLVKLVRQMERMETRMKILEEENREGAIDLTKFYGKDGKPPREH